MSPWQPSASTQVAVYGAESKHGSDGKDAEGEGGTSSKDCRQRKSVVSMCPDSINSPV